MNTVYDYAYDLAGRLSSVQINNVEISNYTYDANRNRSEGVYDGQDRLLSWSDQATNNSYAYTLNGELASKTAAGATTSYSYDVLGNLMQSILPDGTVVDYVVDGQNRRVGKKVNGMLTQGFLYKDQLNPVA